jgi:hypothetical protein
MQFRSPFYLTVQQTPESLWQSAMRTRAWGHDELWATGSCDYRSREEAEREARLWADHEGYRYVSPDAEEIAM